MKEGGQISVEENTDDANIGETDNSMEDILPEEEELTEETFEEGTN